MRTKSQSEKELVSMINNLLKQASDNFTGEWTNNHNSKMNLIYHHIKNLRIATGKNYVINGVELIIEE